MRDALPGDATLTCAKHTAFDVAVPPSPAHTQASWISRLTFTWVYDVVKLGYGRQLQETDLLPLEGHNTTEYERNVFYGLWKEELERPKPSLARALWRQFRRSVPAQCTLSRFALRPREPVQLLIVCGLVGCSQPVLHHGGIQLCAPVPLPCPTLSCCGGAGGSRCHRRVVEFHPAQLTRCFSTFSGIMQQVLCSNTGVCRPFSASHPL